MRTFICLIAFLTTGGFYDLALRTPGGTALQLSDCKGKKVLLVNMASTSRWITQLDHLKELQHMYDTSLVIIGIPSNSFAHEPLDNAGLGQWVVDQHINFLVTEKSIVSGTSQSDLYLWLQYPVLGDFQKYLIDEEGKLIGYFSSDTDPLSPVITNAIAGE